MFPSNRRPTTPGEILLEEFLKPSGTPQVAFAKKLQMSLQRLNGIINGKRAVTAETALLLAQELKTTPDFWLTLQMGVDVWDARQKLAKRSLASGELRVRRPGAVAARARRKA